MEEMEAKKTTLLVEAYCLSTPWLDAVHIAEKLKLSGTSLVRGSCEPVLAILGPYP